MRDDSWFSSEASSLAEDDALLNYRNYIKFLASFLLQDDAGY